MKIYYLVKRMEAIPPCMYNMQIIKDLGYEIIPVIGRATHQQKNILDTFDKAYVLEVSDVEIATAERIFFVFRYRRYVKKIMKEINSNDLLFIGTSDTAIHLYSLIKKNVIVLFLLELHEKPWYNNLFLKKIAHRTKTTAIVCCEKNRSRYLMSKWKLDKLPYSISNKPYHVSYKKNEENIDTSLKKIVKQLGEKKTVIYQSRHISYVQELMQLAKALKEINRDFVLVLIGEIPSDEIKEKIRKIYKNVIFAGAILAPMNLQLTSYGYIGVAVYQENVLNNMFCAPNKIYEYGAFGIPILCNDLPGLVETVGMKRAGVCVDWNSIDDIRRGIIEIDNQYEYYSKNALEMFEKEDNVQKMRKILSEIIN